MDTLASMIPDRTVAVKCETANEEKNWELIEISSEKYEESWSNTTPNEIFSALELGTINLSLGADVEPFRRKFILSYIRLSVPNS